MQQNRDIGFKGAYDKRPILAGFVTVLWLGVIIWGLKGLWSLFRNGNLLMACAGFLLAGLFFITWYKIHNWALKNPKTDTGTNVNDKGNEFSASLINEIESFVEQYIIGASVATQKHLLEDGIMPKSKSWLVHDELLHFFLSYVGILCFENIDDPENAAKVANFLVFAAAIKYWEYFHDIINESTEEQLRNRIEQDFKQRSQKYYNYHDEYINKDTNKDMIERFCFDLLKNIGSEDVIDLTKTLRYVSVAMNMMRSHRIWDRIGNYIASK
jgi:hypothetical protein